MFIQKKITTETKCFKFDVIANEQQLTSSYHQQDRYTNVLRPTPTQYTSLVAY